MTKKLLTIAAVALFFLALSSCGKTKSCAAYSKADIVDSEQVES